MTRFQKHSIKLACFFFIVVMSLVLSLMSCDKTEHAERPTSPFGDIPEAAQHAQQSTHEHPQTIHSQAA